ncbi:cytochrome c [Rhizobium sp. BK376]|uniref:cytochrome c n=1 Tax=Rhizobium sp. BK376 TaxID=2512149 RepID=UPI00140433BA|nr:cytochrome c [Rhizobium sp. BK376]
MGDMRDNTNSAKDVLTNFDTASANRIMERYAVDARAASDMFTGQGGAKEKDLASRFKQLAATANATSQAPMTKAGFRKALSDVTNECKSCHSAYN